MLGSSIRAAGLGTVFVSGDVIGAGQTAA